MEKRNSTHKSLVFLLHKENVGLSKMRVISLFLVVLLAVFTSAGSSWDGVVVTEADYNALRAIKSSFDDPHGVLRSWNDSGATACSGGWLGIKCAKGQVIAIQLPWRGLGGTLSPKFGQITSLRKLSLHDNRIGGQIPPSIGFLPDLRGLVLFNNLLVGLIPPELGNSPSLRSLDLSSNSLSGFVPASLFNSSNLYRLNLSRNSLSGPVPVGLTSSVSVSFVDLSFNNLSGSIPDTWEERPVTEPYMLQSLFIDHNLISGAMPASLVRLDKLEEISLSNNRITGVIPDDIGSLSQLSVLDLSNNRLESRIPDSVDMLQNLTRLDLSENELVGPIPASLVNLPQLEFFNVSYNNLSGVVPLRLARRFNSSSFRGNLLLCGYDAASSCAAAPPPATSDIERPPQTESHGRKLSNRDIILIVVGAVLVFLLFICCILLICLIRRRSGSSSEKAAPSGGIATARGAKSGEQDIEAGGEAGGKLVHFDGPLAFTADDLLCATAEIMGKSTYGTVYRATLEDGSQVAVKRLREKIAKGQKEFETEVNSLGRIRHPNLLALRAYYIGPKGEKLLVFDYMPKGSLSSFLHARGPDTAINWPTRLNIAIGVAQGINHLHTQLNMVHGNLTASNVLLDENTNAKVSDYGLSRLMTAAANSNVIATAGAMGYRAPELSKVKKASTKTDVYSLGVILLELLAGKSPGEVMNGVDLPQWVATNVQEEKTKEVFDLELMSDAAAGEDLLNCLKLALHCVDPAPGARPDAEQVLQRLLEMKPNIVEGSSAQEVGDPSNE